MDENIIIQNKTTCMYENGVRPDKPNGVNDNILIEKKVIVEYIETRDDLYIVDKSETRQEQRNSLNNNEKTIRPKKANSEEENGILDTNRIDDITVSSENNSKVNELELNEEKVYCITEENINKDNAIIVDKNEIILEQINDETCPKTFGSQSDLDRPKENHDPQVKHENHISNGCEGDKSIIHTCSKCSKIFVKKSDFNRHMDWHAWQEELMQSALRESWVKLDRVNIFCCNVCTRGFTKETDLISHRNNHYRKDDPDQAKKPFLCKFCCKRFVQESTLEAHSVLHKPFPHICTCGIGYYLECDLIAHQRILKHFKTPKVERTQPIIYKDTESESESEVRTKRKAKRFKNGMKSKQKTVLPKSNAGEEFEEKYKVMKTESDASDYEAPSNRIKPRLKASLTFKQPKNKVKKCVNNKKSTVVKQYLKDTFGSLDDIFDVKKNKNGKYECEICKKDGIYERVGPYKNHMIKVHQWKFEHKRHCKECGKKFPGDRTLIEHYLHKHKNIKPYKCDICNTGFTQTGALQLHKLIHTGVRNFPCTMCNKSFYNNGTRELHMRTHTGEKPYECSTCFKRFSDPSAFKRHKLIHTGLKPYKCQICPKAFCDPSALFRHTNVLHKKFRVPCTDCDRKFHSKSSMLYHHKISHGKLLDEEKFECDYCGNKFAIKGNLVLHIQRMHLRGNVKCECEICGSVLADEAGAIRHMNVVHLKILPFECDVCGWRFPHRSILEKHKNRVHGPKPDQVYTCEYCLKIFHYKSDLLKHIVRKHLGIKCEFCPKAFSTSIKLADHLKEGCKRCEICSKTFKSAEGLKNHVMFRHTNKNQQKFYDCEYCPKQFVLQTALNRHIRINHRKRKSDFQCDNCGKSYSKKSVLTNHIWDVHMTSARFCDVCLKRFYSESDFLDHKRDGCKPLLFRCQVCDKSLATRNSLRVHLLIHRPKKAECDLCGARFINKAGVLRHLKLVHKHKVK